ncbi:hypothetical protein V2J09_021156 [Rumex salicifolius]
MEALAEREHEELLGVDLVARRSKNEITHYPLPDFGGPIDDIIELESERHGEIDCRSVGKEEGEEDEDERVDGDVSNGKKIGGSHEVHGVSSIKHQLVSDFLPARKSSDQLIHDASIPWSSYDESNPKYLAISENEITHLFSTATSEISFEEHGIGVNCYSNGTINPDESTVLEAKVDIKEIDDVEKVLNEQETHDLFCPNCNSCITKRVILRRRKRKIQEISPSEDNLVEIIPEPVGNPYPPVPETPEEQIDGTKRDAFECLSCFSIFIPIGRGFKLIFGRRDSKETNRDGPQGPQPTTSVAPANVPQDGSVTSLLSRDLVKVTSGLDTIQENNPVHSQPELFPEQAVEPSPLPSGEIRESRDLPEEPKLPPKLDADGSGPEVEEDEVEIVIHGKVPAVPSSSAPQQQVTTDMSTETDPLLKPETVTEAAPAPAAVTAGGSSEVDVIKSIVYGGLLESIASLSVVTSAAGADAKTLNIVVLGAANMFGGLFILAHNLRVLKHESSNERYEEVLGQPGHFTLHSVVAVVSYLVFGLIPPLVYGFSFRESDVRDHKLIVVASASLVCILLLALAKAHTRAPPSRAYTKTLTYYVALWVMVCGVSYAAGELLDFLLQKLGLFESTTSIGIFTPWVSYSI